MTFEKGHRGNWLWALIVMAACSSLASGEEGIEGSSWDPASPGASAGVVEVHWTIEGLKGVTMKPRSPQAGCFPEEMFKWWIDAGGVYQPLVVAYGTDTASKGSALMFLPNLTAHPFKLQALGMELGMGGSRVPIKIPLHPRDCPVETVSENGVVHFGVYDLFIKVEKSSPMKKGGKEEESVTPMTPNRNLIHVVKDLDGKKLWQVSTTFKILRAAEGDDVRKGLRTIQEQLSGPLERLKGWATRIDLTLNPPPPPPSPEEPKKE